MYISKMCVFVVGTEWQSREECLKFLFVLISLIYFLQLPNCCANELSIYLSISIYIYIYRDRQIYIYLLYI